MDLIVGSGVTGLSYAAFCGHDDYLILEADRQIGGYCKTTCRNGFVWDYSGHFFHFCDEGIRDFVMSGIEKSQLVNVAKRTYIKYKDMMIDYPFQKNIHQLPKDEFIDCLYDLFTTEEKAYDNFKDMLYVKFGRSIAEKFLIPYNSKLYACDLNLLDKDAMGRFFPYAAKEDIIRNFKADDGVSYNSSFVYPRSGAVTYINSILNHLDKSKVRTDCAVVRIDRNRHLVETSEGTLIHFDRLISTMPFPKLLELSGIDYDDKIYTWNRVLVFNLGFDRQGQDCRSHWIYFPEASYCFYRVGFYSNILSSDRMSLYVELGFSKDAVIDVTYWLERTLSDLKAAGILDEEQKLLDYEAVEMNPAYVHISPSSIRDVERKKVQLSADSIYSIGRYGSWTYCSIEDNIKEAKSLAESLN